MYVAHSPFRAELFPTTAAAPAAFRARACAVAAAASLFSVRRVGYVVASADAFAAEVAHCRTKDQHKPAAVVLDDTALCLSGK